MSAAPAAPESPQVRVWLRGPREVPGAQVLTEWVRTHGTAIGVVLVPANNIRPFSRRLPGVEIEAERDGKVEHFGIAIHEIRRVRLALERAESLLEQEGYVVDGSTPVPRADSGVR
jgi:hypothetical protein